MSTIADGDEVQANVCTYFVYITATMYRALKRGVLKDQKLELPINIEVLVPRWYSHKHLDASKI